MPTLIDLGQLTKAKYKGQYDDLSDYEVGLKVKSKFPTQYADFADAPEAPAQPKKNLFSKVAGVAQKVQDVAVGAGKAALNTGKNAVNLVGKGMEALAPAPKGNVPSVQQSVEMAIPKAIVTPKNAAEKVGFGIEQAAEFFIPSTAILKVNKAVAASKALKAVPKVLQRSAKLASTPALEAGTAATQTALQDGSAEDVGRNAQIATAVPIVGRGLSVLTKKGIPWLSTLATGVSKPDLVLAKNYPEAMKQAVDHITENPKQPFYALASTIANRLKTNWDDAGKAYESGVAAIGEKLGTKGYDVSRRLDDLAEPLRKANLGLTITKRQGNAAPMAVNQVKVLANRQTPFTSKEIAVLDDLVNTVHQSRKISLNDVIDLSRKFTRAYDAVPLSNDGKATPFHVLVLKLRDKFDDIAEATIPELKPVNAAYRGVRDVWSQFGPSLVDADGAVKPGAESFLTNLGNKNKGAALEQLKKLEELTGIPVEDNVMILRSAERLNNLFPATGSRTQDIVRSLGINAVGFGAGGPLGALLTAAASSPKVAGKVAMLLGKYGSKVRTPAAVTRVFGN